MRVIDAERAARRGLAGLRLAALASLAAALVVWWLTAGEAALDSVGGGLAAALLAFALALPGLLLLHVDHSLRRAAGLVAELRERAGEGESWAQDRRLFMRSVRLAMRERGIGLLAVPWYWLLALWAFAASGLLILGALVLGLAALL